MKFYEKKIGGFLELSKNHLVIDFSLSGVFYKKNAEPEEVSALKYKGVSYKFPSTIKTYKSQE